MSSSFANASGTSAEVGVMFGHASNVEKIEGGRSSLALKPSIVVDHQDDEGEIDIGFTLRGSLEAYPSVSDMNTMRVESGLRLGVEQGAFSGGLEAKVDVRDEEQRVRTATRMQLDTAWQEGPNTFGLTLAAMPVMFRDGSGFSPEYNYGFRDYLALQGEVSFKRDLPGGFSLRPVVMTGAQLPFKDYDLFGLQRGNQTLYGGLNVAYESPRLRASLGGGPVYRQYDEPLYEPTRAFSVEGELTAMVFRDTVVALKADTNFDDTPFLIVKDALTRNVTASILQPLRDNLSVQLAYQLEWTRYLDTPLKDLSHTVAGTLEYRPMPSLALRTTAQYEHIENHALGLQAENFEVLLGMALKYDRKSGILADAASRPPHR